MTTAYLAGYLVKAAADPAPVTPPVTPPVPAPKIGNMDKLHKAVGYAETGHLKNPYVRTGHSGEDGSAAFGKYQMGNVLIDYTPDGNPGFYKTLNPPQQNHLNALHNQRKAFLRFGKEPNQTGYHPKWEYSHPNKPGQGVGLFGNITPQQKQLHDQVSRSIMEDQVRRRGLDPKTVTLQQVANIWQGTEMPADHRANWMRRAKDYIKSQ